jgi:hypothetical protein
MRLGIGAALIAVWLMFSGVLPSRAAAQEAQPAESPRHVVDAFELARGAGDVEGALSQLADTAVITVQNKHSSHAFNGPVELRTYMQGAGTHFQTIMRSSPVVQGDRVTWTERDQFGSQSVDATVVALVSRGQIVSLTYNDSESAGGPGRLAAAGARQPLQVPSFAWPAGLVAAGLVMLGLVFGWPRRKVSESQLNGRLVVALRRDREMEMEGEHEKRAA